MVHAVLGIALSVATIREYFATNGFSFAIFVFIHISISILIDCLYYYWSGDGNANKIQKPLTEFGTSEELDVLLRIGTDTDTDTDTG